MRLRKLRSLSFEALLLRRILGNIQALVPILSRLASKPLSYKLATTPMTNPCVLAIEIT